MTVRGDHYQFGSFRLDPVAGILYHQAEPTMLGQRAVALLRRLLDSAGMPVSKDALVEAGWGGLAVADNNLTVQIAALRRVLASPADGARWIETLPRRGYRYVGPVVVTNDAPATTGAATALTLPDKPSVAVLPFSNLSGDPEQDYFADGMVDDIITGLARINWLFVIARNSTFTYKGRAVDIKQVGRELGVRYVLEGSVRKSANRVRITGQLINAATGAHLWADHFDGALDDIFDLQDRVAVEVCGIIGTALEAAEQRRSLRKPTDDLTAYDLYLRALAEAQSWEKVRILRALDLLKQALDRDPNYGPALALAATCHANLYVNNWTDDLELTRREGFDLARRVLLIVDDPSLVARGAYALAQFGDDLATATTLIDRALHLNPSFAYGWIWSGWVRLFAGKPELAIEHFKTAIRLSPREGTAGAGAHVGIGIGHLFARRFEEAEAMLLLALRERPSWAPTYRFLASCYAHMGRLDEARSIVKRLRDITPVVVPSATHWRDPGYREFYLQGLRLAADQPE